jgi:lactate 2-monooxygenase
MASEHYGNYQMEIYLDGLHGKLPRFPVDHESLEAAAVEVLPSWIYSYLGYGAGDGRTQQANVDAFGRYAIVPRMLVAPMERDLSVSLFDMQLPTPLFMPPVGVVGVCSQDMHGDIAAAKASAITGVPMVASTLTQDRMEDVRPHSGETRTSFSSTPPPIRSWRVASCTAPSSPAIRPSPLRWTPGSRAGDRTS